MGSSLYAKTSGKSVESVERKTTDCFMNSALNLTKIKSVMSQTRVVNIVTIVENISDGGFWSFTLRNFVKNNFII